MTRYFIKNNVSVALIDLITDHFLCSELTFLLQSEGYFEVTPIKKVNPLDMVIYQNLVKAILRLYLKTRSVKFFDKFYFRIKQIQLLRRFLGIEPSMDAIKHKTLPGDFPQASAFSLIPNNLVHEVESHSKLHGMHGMYFPSCNLYIQYFCEDDSQENEIINCEYPIPLSRALNSSTKGERDSSNLILLVEDPLLFNFGTIYNLELVRICTELGITHVSLVNVSETSKIEIFLSSNITSLVYPKSYLYANQFDSLHTLISNSNAVLNLTNESHNFVNRLSNILGIPYVTFDGKLATYHSDFYPATILGKLRMFPELLELIDTKAVFSSSMESEDIFRITILDALKRIS